jgi:hypothetical protein
MAIATFYIYIYIYKFSCTVVVARYVIFMSLKIKNLETHDMHADSFGVTTDMKFDACHVFYIYDLVLRMS